MERPSRLADRADPRHLLAVPQTAIEPPGLFLIHPIPGFPKEAVEEALREGYDRAVAGRQGRIAGEVRRR